MDYGKCVKERREIYFNPCTCLITALIITAAACFVPLSIKGYITMETSCSEFRLDDPYIAWPHVKEQVKHTKELCLFGLVTFITLIFFSIMRPSPVNQVVVNIGERLWYILNIQLFRLLHTGYYILLGYLMLLVFLGFVKHSSGELRPCFLDLCDPNMTLVEEQRAAAYPQPPEEVLLNKDVCTNKNIEYFCMSFFSGHTVTAFYAATICAIMLHYMDTKWRLFSVRLLLQILIMSSATWVGMTRLRDHYHHVIDIVVAAVSGMVMAIFMMMSPLRSFDELQLGNKCGETGPLLGHY